MNFGAPTPVEVAVIGPDFAASRTFADQAARRAEQDSGRCAICNTSRRSTTRVVEVNIDRRMAGQLGVTVESSRHGRFPRPPHSSRFVAPNYWADPNTGIAFQVQMQYPQPR